MISMQLLIIDQHRHDHAVAVPYMISGGPVHPYKTGGMGEGIGPQTTFGGPYTTIIKTESIMSVEHHRSSSIVAAHTHTYRTLSPDLMYRP